MQFASSIAQKAGFWGLPVKYGLGRAITSDEEQTTYGEGLSEIAKNYNLTNEPLIPKLDKEIYEKMTGREKAIYKIKKKINTWCRRNSFNCRIDQRIYCRW